MTTWDIPAAGYKTVLADPPWEFELRSEKGEGKSPQAHYPCMTYDELVAFGRDIRLDFICAPDSVMVMWATFPKLFEAMALLREWGWAYKTGGAWAKTTRSGKQAFGTGYIYRGSAELWLLGTRGQPKTFSRAVRNSIIAPVGIHSRKPYQMYYDLEYLFPGPRLELFATRTRPGWDSYGNAIKGFKRTADNARGVFQSRAAS